jgi:hypothetical protein
MDLKIKSNNELVIGRSFEGELYLKNSSGVFGTTRDA